MISNFWLRAAKRLKALRLKRKLAPAEMAASAGITIEAYYDLEQTDDMLDCLSLRALASLLKILQTHPNYLFFEKLDQTKRSTMEDLCKASISLKANNSSAWDDFQNQVGYDLGVIAEWPRSIEAWNLKCLIAVCDHFGIPWVSILSELTS